MAGNDRIMGACTVQITQGVINSIQAVGKRYKVRDTTIPGLLLRVGTTGKMVWYLDYRSRNGSRRTHKIGSLDHYKATAAKAEARILLGKLADGEDPAEKRAAEKAERKHAVSRTLRRYLEGEYWDKTLRYRKSGLATKKRILSVYEQILDEDMAGLAVRQLKALRAKRQANGVTPQTLNRDRTALLALLNQAVKDEVLTDNPISKFERLEQRDDKRVRFLGQLDDHENLKDKAGRKIGERERFLTALGNQKTMIQSIVKLALNTGLRRGEIFGLQWRNVDFKQRQLTVTAATAKSNKTRHIPLNQTAIDLLKHWKKANGNVRHLNDLVFPSPQTGERLNNIKRSWAALVKEARIENFLFHDCRHDFASRLVQNGVSLYTVRDIIGHSSIVLTERYAHLSDDQKKSAVEVLV